MRILNLSGPYSPGKLSRAQPSPLAGADRDPASIGPFQERNQVFPADPQPVTNLAGGDDPCFAQVEKGFDQLLKGGPGIVPVPLHRFELSVSYRQPERSREVSRPHFLAQLRRARRHKPGFSDVGDEPVDLIASAFHAGCEAAG